MSAINALLQEVRFETLKIAVLFAFLDAALLFLASMLLASIFSMGVLIPLILSVLFFAYALWRYMRRISLKYIEDRNPEIREMLRTAADNKGQESLMAHALFSEVVQKMREVSSGSFLSMKKLGFKLTAVFALSMLLVGMAFFNVNIQKFEDPLANTRDRLGRYFSGLTGGNESEQVQLGEAGDIYGDPSIAQLGSDQLDITLQQSLNQLDFNSVSGADPSGAQLDDYPAEVDAQASEAYTGGLEDITDRKTAAEYSQQIK